jgi:hypothetical protein
MRYVGKYAATRHGTGDNIIWRRKGALCMPDNYSRNTKRMLITFNTYS